MDKDEVESKAVPAPASVVSHKPESLSRRLFPTGFKKEFKEMFKLAWPMILTMFSQNFIPAIAVMFSGHLGRTALNAVSLANSIINVTGLSVGMGLATACDTLFSQSFGSSNKKKVGHYLQKALLIIMVACLPCWAIHLNTETILRVLGQEEETSRLGGQYLLYYMPALLFNFTFQVLSKYIQNQNVVIPNVIIGLVGVAVNVAMHYIFLYTLHWGTNGSAISQVIANFVVCILTLAYIIVSGIYRETWDGWSIDCLQNWNLILKLAIPGMLMICLEWWCFEIGTLVSGIIGEGVQLGAQSIMFQLEAIGFMIPMGISIAVSIRVGQHLGSGSPDGAKTACRVSILIGLVCSLVIGIVFMVFRFLIPKIFSDDPAVIDTAASVLPILGLFTIIDGIAGINGGILRGCGRQVVGAVAIFIGLYVVALPVGIPLLLLTSLQVSGLWWGYVIGMSFEAILLTTLVITTNWELESQQAQLRAGIVDDSTADSTVIFEDNISTDESTEISRKVSKSVVTSVIPESAISESVIPEGKEKEDSIDERTHLLGPKRLSRPDGLPAKPNRRFSSPASTIPRSSSSAEVGSLTGSGGRRYSTSRFVNALHGRRFSTQKPLEKKMSLPDMKRRYSSPYISPVREIVVDSEPKRQPVWRAVLLRILVLLVALAIFVAGLLISIYVRYPSDAPPPHLAVTTIGQDTSVSNSFIQL